MAEPADEDVPDRYTVRSVARAMRLIEIVADGPAEGRSLSELARELGASKSTTLALARTLASAGMLRDSRPGPRYSLGTALIRLGDITKSQLPLGDICRPVLSQPRQCRLLHKGSLIPEVQVSRMLQGSISQAAADQEAVDQLRYGAAHDRILPKSKHGEEKDGNGRGKGHKIIGEIRICRPRTEQFRTKG